MQVLISLIGAVALLLWGMQLVRQGIIRAFGADLKAAIGMSVANRFSALLVGAAITTLLQSSTATGMMVASFAGRGLIATAPALAVMLGADIGTTLVAQLLSFDISWLSPLMIGIGMLASAKGHSYRTRELGGAAKGLGLMLLSLQIIVMTSALFRESAILATIFAALADDYLLALVFAALLTWFAHSSLAIVLLIMSLVSTDVIPLELAFVLVIGANVGAAIAPMVAAMGEGVAARRVPLGNLLFKLTAAALLLPLLTVVSGFVAGIDADMARQVVNFHLLFNLLIAIVFIYLIKPVACLTAYLLPDRQTATGKSQLRTTYIEDQYLGTPSVALSAASRETIRMGDVVERMFALNYDALRNNDLSAAKMALVMDDEVDILHEKLRRYLSAISRAQLEQAESDRVTEILVFATKLEHIGDIVENMAAILSKKIENKHTFSSAGRDELLLMHSRVHQYLKMLLGAFLASDQRLARHLMAQHASVSELEEAGVSAHIRRLRDGRLESLETSVYHMDLLRDLGYINNHIRSLALPLADSVSIEEQTLIQSSAQ